MLKCIFKNFITKYKTRYNLDPDGLFSLVLSHLIHKRLSATYNVAMC